MSSCPVVASGILGLSLKEAFDGLWLQCRSYILVFIKEGLREQFAGRCEVSHMHSNSNGHIHVTTQALAQIQV